MASVDVIVTGIGLSSMTDGLELVRAVRRDVRRRVPVIVLSAYAYPRDRERAFAAGCDAFLTKPCLPPALLTEILEVLDAFHRTTATAANSGAINRARGHMREAVVSYCTK